MTVKRIAPLSGLGFVVVLVVSFVVLGGGSSTPRTDASGATIASFYTRHHGTAMTAAYLLPVAVLLLLIFAVSFWQAFRDAHLGAGLFLAGAVMASACLLVAAATHAALARAAQDKLASASLQAINAIDQPAADAFAAIAILVLGAAGALIQSRQRRTRLMGYVALVLAIVGLTPAGMALFPLTAIWIAALSLMLFTGAIPTSPSMTTLATPPVAN